MSIKFVQKGNVVVMKREDPNQEFTAKQVLQELQVIEHTIHQRHQEMDKILNAKIDVENSINALMESNKNLGKHREWARKVNESKLKSYVDEKLDKYKKQVEDEKSGEEGPNAMYAKLQNYIGRDKDVAENVHQSVIQKLVYEDCIFENPWANE